MEAKNSLRYIIGKRIRDNRKRKGWTQEQLAEKASMHPTYVGKAERGEKSLTLDSLENIVNALEITYEELFKYIKPSAASTENPVLWQIVNTLSTKSADDQSKALSLLEFIFEWKEK